MQFNMFSGQCFYVTGATGRLGCAAAKRLEELGAEVVPLTLGGYPHNPKRVKWRAEAEPLKILNSNELDELPEPDYVIHFHWEIGENSTYIDQLAYEIDHNIYSLRFFWDWLAEKTPKRFVSISTLKIFSHLNETLVSAETEPRPYSAYGVAKYASEKFFDAYFHKTAFSTVHLRLCSVTGFGEHPSRLISRLYKSAFAGERITVNAGHKVYLIYIDEMIDLIINAALKAKKDRYLLVKDGWPVEEIARRFEDISGKHINADYKDLAPGHNDPEFISDHRELEADWVRSADIDTAISKIIKLNSIGDI